MTDAGGAAGQAAAEEPKERVRIVPYADEHAAALGAFFLASWGTDPDAEGVRRTFATAGRNNPVAPGTPPPTVLALKGARVIGYCSSLPVRFWDGHVERGGYWAKGLMVLPEFRNGPIGFLVLKELTKLMPFATAVTVHPASRRLFGASGYTGRGPIPNYVRPLAAGRILHQLDLGAIGLRRLPPWMLSVVRLGQRTGLALVAGGIAGLAHRALTAVRLGGRVLRITIEATPTRDELDALWGRVRGTLAAGTVRDATAFLPRYGDGSAAQDYRYALVHDRAELVGLCIVRRPRASGDARLRGIRVAAVSELLFPTDRPDVGMAALRGAARLARRFGAHATLCTASHEAAGALMGRAGYLSFPGNIHFFLRDTAGGSSWPESLNEWWLTRGDGESDETF